MKTCSTCKKTLPTENFYKNPSKPDGLSNVCKECTKTRVSLWQKNNPDKCYRNQKNSREARRKKDVCMNCGSKRLDQSLLCEEHWFKNVSIQRLGTSKHWLFLKELAEKQNFKCAYTGEPLVMGDNMSLDHIVSIHDDPALADDLNNVQWVTKDINVIKNKLSHDSFLKLCKLICTKFNL